MAAVLRCVLVISIFALIQLGQSEVEVSLYFTSYNNPTRQDFNGGHCDIFGHCDHFFHICVDKLHGGNGRGDGDECMYYSEITGVYPNDNQVRFNHDLHGLRNPIVFSIKDWQGGFLLKVDVWETDSFPRRKEQVDFIHFTYTTDPAVNKSMVPRSDSLVIRGIRHANPTSLTVNINAYCAKHHITRFDMCDTLCQTRDDERGHYTCTATGDKVCLEGWKDIHSDCRFSINDCHKDHSCKNGGTCVDDLNNYLCKCPPGYRGPTCDDSEDACKDDPCRAGLFCVSKGKSYSCENTPIVLQSTTVTSSMSPLVIGLIVGMLLFILIVVALGLILYRQRRQKRRKNQATNAVVENCNMGQQTNDNRGRSAQTNPVFFTNAQTHDTNAVYQNQMNGQFAATSSGSSQTPGVHMTSSGTNTPGGAGNKMLEAGLLMPPPYVETEIQRTAGAGNFADSGHIYNNEDVAPERPPPRLVPRSTDSLNRGGNAPSRGQSGRGNAAGGSRSVANYDKPVSVNFGY